MRYAHSAAYLTRLAREHGFVVQRQWEAPLPEDQDVPVLGLYVCLEPKPQDREDAVV